MIFCESVVKYYQKTAVLQSASLKVNQGSLISIVGASGAGKSTLLHIIGTLEEKDSGTVQLDGVDIDQLKVKDLADFRNQKIGFVFQFHHLLPEFTALENICLPAWIAKKPESGIQKEAQVLADILGISHRLDHKPSQLSGGEQQRVAIARALINKPKIVLADEPTGNLDQENSSEVFQLLLKLRNEYGLTMVIVTHDRQLAAQTDLTYEMKNGKIISELKNMNGENPKTS
ncbi:MAG TPA: ABC transporter ATP-binding protein [Saprospiraceae bacterium]|nr:ABC transporter ATP-binding protein [Saprospiraceae bacterium]